VSESRLHAGKRSSKECQCTHRPMVGDVLVRRDARFVVRVLDAIVHKRYFTADDEMEESWRLGQDVVEAAPLGEGNERHLRRGSATRRLEQPLLLDVHQKEADTPEAVKVPFASARRGRAAHLSGVAILAERRVPELALVLPEDLTDELRERGALDGRTHGLV
jgi:hypothetical protein